MANTYYAVVIAFVFVIVGHVSLFFLYYGVLLRTPEHTVKINEHKPMHLDCFSEHYLVYQPHHNDIINNIVVGYTRAFRFAAYTKRILILGNPPREWSYLNSLPLEENISNDTGELWNTLNENYFWDYYFNSEIIDQCTKEVQQVAGIRISTKKELIANEASVLVVNLDQGPKFVPLIDKGKVNGQYPPGSLGSNNAQNREAQVAVQKMLSSFNDKVYIGFLMREAMIFLEYGISHSLNIKEKYSGFHMRGGDKANKVSNLPQYDNYLKEIVKDKCEIPIYLSGIDNIGIKNIINSHHTQSNVFRLPFNSSLNSEECHHPCMVVDKLFDIEMLSRSHYFLGHCQSAMSKLMKTLHKDKSSCLSHNSRNKHKFHPWQHDLRMRTDSKVGYLIVDSSMTQQVVSLLSVHPWLFLISDLRRDQHSDKIMENCEFSEKGQTSLEHSFATPGVFFNDSFHGGDSLIPFCLERPIKVSVISKQDEKNNNEGNVCFGQRNCFDHSQMKIPNEADYIYWLNLIQIEFGLPNILEERNVLSWWWNKHKPGSTFQIPKISKETGCVL